MVTLASGQEKKMEMPGGVKGAFLKQSMFVENQFVQLAEAIPQEKYSWRPADGVRSIAEAFLHVASGNYLMMKTIGAALPEGVDPMKMEKSTTDKKQIVEAMKKSFAFINEQVKKTEESSYGKEVDFFGNKMTVLDMIFLGATHQHETIGQAIAYARTNGITPPWTEERTKQQQQKKKTN
jgi:uncharacterized damage-inducible protein DinB